MKNHLVLQNEILAAFKRHMNKMFLDGYSYMMFLAEVFKFHILLKQMNLKRGETVMLVGTPGFEWKAVYMAAFLTGVDLFIIPHGMSETEIAYYANRFHAYAIFLAESDRTMFESRAAFAYCWGTQVIYSLFDHNVVKATNANVNALLSTNFLINELQVEPEHMLDSMKGELSNISTDVKVYTLTSGLEGIYPKIVMHTSSTIYQGSEIAPIISSSAVTCVKHLEKYHVLLIMTPFLKGIGIRRPGHHAFFKTDVVFDAEEFKAFWRQMVFDRRQKGLLSIKWFRNRWIRSLLNSSFNEVVILNANIPDAWIKLMYQSCSLVTTFGVEEANHIVAINPYTDKTYRQVGCIGIPAHEEISVHDNGAIVGPHVLREYAKDAEWTATAKPRKDMVVVNDRFVVKTKNNKPYIFYLGSAKETVNDTSLDRIEKEFLESPLAEQVVIAHDVRGQEDPPGYVLVVYPNIAHGELLGIGKGTVKTYFEEMVGKMNLRLDEPFIKQVVISIEPLFTTYDGKVKAFNYRS